MERRSQTPFARTHTGDPRVDQANRMLGDAISSIQLRIEKVEAQPVAVKGVAGKGLFLDPSGNANLKMAQPIPDSTATTVAGLVADFNKLLASLRKTVLHGS